MNKVYAVDLSQVPPKIVLAVLEDDELLIEYATDQGLVWSLKEFEQSFNDGKISNQYYITIK